MGYQLLRYRFKTQFTHNLGEFRLHQFIKNLPAIPILLSSTVVSILRKTFGILLKILFLKFCVQVSASPDVFKTPQISYNCLKNFYLIQTCRTHFLSSALVKLTFPSSFWSLRIFQIKTTYGVTICFRFKLISTKNHCFNRILYLGDSERSF